MQKYINFAGIVIILCLGLTLNNYLDVCAIPYHTSFDSLRGSDNLFTEYVRDQLFPTNLVDFQINRRLKPWLYGLDATLIMSYIQMEDKYGNKNIVVCCMDDVFQSKDGLTMNKLKSWSQSICDYFTE